MLHPSYSDLMEVVNSQADGDEHPTIQSRYSIVMATSKRARQIIEHEKLDAADKKPLSIAVDELYNKEIHIVGDEEE